GRAAGWRRWMLLLCTVACTAVGWFIKQEAITLPGAAVLLIWLAWPRDVSVKHRFAASALLASSLLLMMTLPSASGSLPEVAANSQRNGELVAAGFEQTLPFMTYIRTAVVEYGGYYLRRFLVPTGLSADPGTNPITTFFSV